MNQQFRRAFLTGKLSDPRARKQASMLAERHLIAEVHQNTRMQVFKFIPRLGVAAEISFYKESMLSLLEMTWEMGKEYDAFREFMREHFESTADQLHELRGQLAEMTLKLAEYVEAKK